MAATCVCQLTCVWIANVLAEYAVEVKLKGADGSLEPFHIYVGAPEIRESVHACLLWCSSFSHSMWQGGPSPEIAYREAFLTLGRMIEDLDLLNEDSTPFALPIPEKPNG